jgi:hypothetical protein
MSKPEEPQSGVKHYQSPLFYPAKELSLKARSTTMIEVLGLPRRGCAIVSRCDLPREPELLDLRSHPSAAEALQDPSARELYLEDNLYCMARRSSASAPPGGDKWELLK